MQAIVELGDRGCAVLLVEEDARNALMVAGTVAVTDLGRLVWCSPPAAAALDILSGAYVGGAPVVSAT